MPNSTHKPRVNRRLKVRRAGRGARPGAAWRQLATVARARLAALRGPAQVVVRGLSLLLSVVVFLAGSRWVERHLHTARFFATRHVQITGNERLSRPQVLDAMGVREGQNVFQVSEEQAAQRLLAHPWVAGARVERRLPGTYRVELREREAIALISLDRLYLLSEADGLFKPVELGDPVDLPVVTGVDPEAFTQNRVFRVRVLSHVVQFLHDYRDAGLFRREPVQEILLARDEALSVYVGDDAIHVRVGRPPFRKKLRRFRKVLDRLRAKNARASYVYLDNVRRPDRVTVRLR